MKTSALAALALLLPLAGGLGACSSDDDQSSGARPTSSGSGSSTPASPAPSTPSGPAVSLAGHGGGSGVATYCLIPLAHGFPDFAWTGVRLAVHDDATLTAVRAQTQQVRILHSWVVEGGNGNTGAIVPWSTGRRIFLPKLDWPHRTPARGADLTPGTAYTLVLRLRPQSLETGGGLQGLEVHYRSSAGRGSVTTSDILKFDRSC